MKFRRSFTPILLACLLAAVFGLLMVPSAHAAQSLTVTDCTSDAQLQADVSAANTDNAGDTITFACNGDIKLASTLMITGDMTLDGSGHSVTLDGGNSVEVLYVNGPFFSSTFTLNALTIAHGSSGNGGGLDNGNGTVNISNSTFVNNSAGSGGGGVTGDGQMNFVGSIVANNTGGDCPQGGFLIDQGYNLESGTDCGFTGTGSLQNTDPKLDPSGLQNNGGLTQTIALLSSSPAIDHIPAAKCPASDQRGMTRPDDGETTCDIGAYESNYVPVDNDLGLANMPANITTNATSPQGAVVTYTPPTATDESGDSSTASVTCTPASGSTFSPGTTTVTCTVSDSDDTNSPVSQSFTVTVNQGLTASGKSVSTTEGSAFSGVVATGTAYGTGTLSASITWGDGNTSAGTVTLNPDGSYSVAGSHTYGEEGSSFAITVQVSASGGQSATGTGSAAVADAALKGFVTKVFIKGNISVLLTMGFIDADPKGTVSDYTATINWGDGTKPRHDLLDTYLSYPLD